MTGKYIAAGQQVAHVLLLACSFTLFGALLYHHCQLILLAVPLDYNEAGMLSITSLIATGENPFSLANQPMHTFVYPVLYNIVVAPLTWVFGATLPVHRAVAGLFILLSCGILYRVLRRHNASLLESFAAATLWYAGLLYYSTPIASPNSLGLFLFFSSIALPWLYGFSRCSLGVAMIIGILAFYGKQYHVACLGFIALYLFVCVSMKRALVFGAVSLLLFLVVLSLVTYTSPYFLDNTVFAVGYITGSVSSFETAFKQLFAFTKIYAPLLGVLILHTVLRVTNHTPTVNYDSGNTSLRKKTGYFNIVELNAPFLNVRINYFWLCLVCSLLVIIFSIGKNPGNYLTYLFQILSPFVLIVCFRSIAESEKLKPLYYLLVIACFWSSYSLLSHDFSTNTREWERIHRIMSSADKIYASTLVLPEISRTGKETFQNGHTRYFQYAEEKPRFFSHENAAEDTTQLWTDYSQHILGMIEARKFDLILLDQWMPLPEPSPRSNLKVDSKAVLREHYYHSEDITLNLAKRPGGGSYRIAVWKPKPESGPGNEYRHE